MSWMRGRKHKQYRRSKYEGVGIYNCDRVWCFVDTTGYKNKKE